MVKSGLIVGVVMFFLVLGAALISPFCALCIPLFAGLGAGYLAGVFDKPATSNDMLKRGAGAGAIAGVIAVFAQIIAAVVNVYILQNPQFNPGKAILGQPIDPSSILMGQAFSAICVGGLNVLLTAAFGAGGGAIWSNTAGKPENLDAAA